MTARGDGRGVEQPSVLRDRTARCRGQHAAKFMKSCLPLADGSLPFGTTDISRTKCSASGRNSGWSYRHKALRKPCHFIQWNSLVKIAEIVELCSPCRNPAEHPFIERILLVGIRHDLGVHHASGLCSNAALISLVRRRHSGQFLLAIAASPLKCSECIRMTILTIHRDQAKLHGSGKFWAGNKISHAILSS